MKKTCKECGHSGLKEDFKPGRRICHACYRRGQKDWYQENKEIIAPKQEAKRVSVPARLRHIHRTAVRYRVSKEWLEHLWEFQGKICAICKSPQAFGKGAWHVDHDHATNTIRGFLCHFCNFGLGNFKDNKESLASAISYLSQTPATACGPDKWKPGPVASPTHKTCFRCQESKELQFFHLSAKTKYGRSDMCIVCTKAYHHDYYMNNKGKVKAQLKAWYKANTSKSNAQSKQWRLDHPERCRDATRRYREKKRKINQLELEILAI